MMRSVGPAITVSPKDPCTCTTSFTLSYMVGNRMFIDLPSSSSMSSHLSLFFLFLFIFLSLLSLHLPLSLPSSSSSLFFLFIFLSLLPLHLPLSSLSPSSSLFFLSLLPLSSSSFIFLPSLSLDLLHLSYFFSHHASLQPPLVDICPGPISSLSHGSVEVKYISFFVNEPFVWHKSFS